MWTLLVGVILTATVSFLLGWYYAATSPWKWLSVLALVLILVLELSIKGKLDAGLEKRFRDAKAWRRGSEGERVVAGILANELPDTYQVFNDVHFPGRVDNIDHLVVGPSGVFVLDTKNWRGIVECSQDGKGLLLNGKPKDNSAKAAKATAWNLHEKLKALLNRDIFIKPVLVFPMAKVIPHLNTVVDLQQDDYLVKYIAKRKLLSNREVDEIAKALQALFRESVYRLIRELASGRANFLVPQTPALGRARAVGHPIPPTSDQPTHPGNPLSASSPGHKKRANPSKTDWPEEKFRQRATLPPPSEAVPSPLRVLTSVFGMETGIALAPWSPEKKA